MIFSRDYVGYLARQTVKILVDAKMIETAKPAVLNERVTAAMIDELALKTASTTRSASSSTPFRKTCYVPARTIRRCSKK